MKDSAMKIEEVQSTTKKQRIAVHTHIKGLGLEVTLRYFVPSVSLFIFLYFLNDFSECLQIRRSMEFSGFIVLGFKGEGSV